MVHETFFTYFFYHCLLKKLPFSIWFKLSWKVPGCPRFAPFHCKFWKIFRGGKTPRTPPLVASPRCARVSEQIYPFLVRIYPFWTKNLPPSNFGVGRSAVCLCVRIFQRHQKTQGHEILALGLIWVNLYHYEARFLKF